MTIAGIQVRGDNALAYGGNSGDGENTKAQDMVSKVRVDYFLRMREKGKENQGGHQSFWSKQLTG